MPIGDAWLHEAAPVVVAVGWVAEGADLNLNPRKVVKIDEYRSTKRSTPQPPRSASRG
jgi:hypothetical protein